VSFVSFLLCFFLLTFALHTLSFSFSLSDKNHLRVSVSKREKMVNMMEWQKQQVQNGNVEAMYVKVMTDEQLETLRKQIAVYATICEQLVEMHKTLSAQQDLAGTICFFLFSNYYLIINSLKFLYYFAFELLFKIGKFLYICTKPPSSLCFDLLALQF